MPQVSTPLTRHERSMGKRKQFSKTCATLDSVTNPSLNTGHHDSEDEASEGESVAPAALAKLGCPLKQLRQRAEYNVLHGSSLPRTSNDL